MLRITTTSDGNTDTLKLEGKLVQPWVAEVEKTWKNLQKTARQRDLVVDLNAVSSIDNDGKRLLRQMHMVHAEFLADGPFLRHMLRQIKENSEKRK